MLPLRSGIGEDAGKLLAQSLFSKIKPICVELSQVLNAPEFNINKVRSLLTSLEAALYKHLKEAQDQVVIYRLPETVADYIFFPISNLLKFPRLDDSITQHILAIIGFLIDNAWSFNVNYNLIDQLFPLLVYLSGFDTKAQETSLSEKSLQFKSSSISALFSISKTLTRSYFQGEGKRLVFLSNSISIVIDIIGSTTPNSQEAIKVLEIIFDTILQLVQCLTSSQQSQILPGIVSSVTTFGSKNSNIPAELTIRILKVLSFIICNSFNDNELHAELDVHHIKNLKDLEVVWNTNEVATTERCNITITETDHRSLSWVKATSKQLKISLTVFFKTILHSEKNKQRLKSKPELYNEVINFVSGILNSCFATLFTEFASLSIDILSSLVYASSYGEEKDINDKISSISNMLCLCLDDDSKAMAFFEILHSKLLYLLQNKLTSTLFSIDEEKVSMTIASLKLNFQLLFDLSRSQSTDYQVLNELRKFTLKLFRQHMLDRFNLENSKSASKIGNSDTLIPLNEGESSNKLDSIELPEYVNVHNIATQNKTLTKSTSSYIHNLQLISRNWNEASILANSEESSTLGIGTKLIEFKVAGFIQFLSNLRFRNDSDSTLNDLEDIFMDCDDNSLETSLSLWIATRLIKNYTSSKSIEEHEFDPDKFLDFTETEEESSYIDEELDAGEESLYLVLAKSEELISSVSSKDDGELNVSDELIYCCALDAINELAGKLSKEQFQSDFLMDNLLVLIKSLTYNNRPRVQQVAQNTVKSILEAYYDNSMKKLIIENSDYLIDSLSLQMSVASNLTPVLPGILVIIIKITGIQLLESNQLTDILTEMFVLLDTYHGYNKLAESFFVVFESLTEQINKQYGSRQTIKSADNINSSSYKPWGMSSKEQMMALISGAGSVLDSVVEYDSTKEYFKRKTDVPFSEISQDSDDEDESEEEQEEEEEEEEEWQSVVPKKVYFILQRIFNYGFVLIAQPSFSLRAQIIKTLRLIFPLLCFNYKLVLPVIASNWPLLVTLISGSKSLSTYPNIDVIGYTSEETNLMFQSLEFVTEILTEDVSKEEYFFARKFQEAWEFMSEHSKLISSKGTKDELSKERSLTVSQSPLRTHPKLRNVLIKFLITGVQAYERTIPDIVRYNVVSLCHRLKIPEDLILSRDTAGIIEVLQSHEL
ncbi:uncharacterized protein SPAPADRAFT_145555 [Spathaspora passalidarum NRRL Y-27907]|uniref:TEL2-interacting protein 1 n=1 Tax=Spathaspora passalidarum (strain NRRL Y-27907 / 11-Y1) TaxID=619300 RepID=G3AFC8_SPAPN|nr:uncharacterized protein SPAPADRAFT_145555 [Spathaspora passalidarum NRRL Y-27907]EGW34915.1 hypothetical protein SPAPADRAFT_145555 [Spathaspora passalidarum NRRL Y-27907]